MFLGIVVLTSGIYSILISILSDTNTVLSAMIFKVIPFFLGLGCLLAGIRMLNLLEFILK